jgi:hypothetical protein
MKMKDPVMNDEAKYDRMCEAQEVLMETGRASAQAEYKASELDDWLEDDSDPHDNFMLAHALVSWLDSGKPVEDLIAWMPACSLKDFRANVEHVIELRAVMIAGDQ